jgi:hypothetical protein
MFVQVANESAEFLAAPEPDITMEDVKSEDPVELTDNDKGDDRDFSMWQMDYFMCHFVNWDDWATCHAFRPKRYVIVY